MVKSPSFMLQSEGCPSKSCKLSTPTYLLHLQSLTLQHLQNSILLTINCIYNTSYKNSAVYLQFHAAFFIFVKCYFWIYVFVQCK